MAKEKSIVWTTGLVVKTFDLDHVYTGFKLLSDLMTVDNDLTATDIEMLDYRREQLTRNVNGWNEETLKMKFIAFIFAMKNFFFSIDNIISFISN